MNSAERRAAGAGAVYPWATAALLALANLFSLTDRLLLGLVQEPIKAAYGLSDATLGLLQGTGFAVLYAAAVIPCGMLADRVSRPLMVGAALVLCGVATMAAGLAGGVAALFASRIALGLGAAGLTPPAAALIAATAPPGALGRTVALFTGAGSLGRATALLGGGALLSALAVGGGLALGPGLLLEPWRGVFVLAALPQLALAPALFLLRDPQPAAERARAWRLAAALSHVRGAPLTYALYTAAAACGVLAVQTLAGWATSYFVRAFALGVAEAGVRAGAVLLVAGPLGHFAGGMLTDALRARGVGAAQPAVIMLALLTGVAALPLLLFATDLRMALMAFGVVSFCLTMSSPASLSGLQLLTPAAVRGAVTGMFVMVTTLVGLGVGPFLVGLIADTAPGDAGLRLGIGVVLTAACLAGAGLACASRGPFSRAASIHR